MEFQGEGGHLVAIRHGGPFLSVGQVCFGRRWLIHRVEGGVVWDRDEKRDNGEIDVLTVKAAAPAGPVLSQAFCFTCTSTWDCLVFANGCDK